MPSDQNTSIPAVPVKTPMFDEDGNLTRTWIIFFERVFKSSSSTTINNNTGGAPGDNFERFVFGIGLINEVAVENNVTPKITVERKCQLVRWHITAITAPVGATLYIDIKRNGTSILPAGLGNKIGLPSLGIRNTGITFVSTPVVLLYEDELTCDVLQVGTTTPGFRVEVQLVGLVIT